MFPETSSKFQVQGLMENNNHFSRKNGEQECTSIKKIRINYENDCFNFPESAATKFQEPD